MDGSGEDVDLFSGDQLVDVGRRLGGIGLVVDGHPLHVPATELAAVLGGGELHRVGDVVAERRVGSRVWQQQPDAQLGGGGGE